jgi:hypothetical protein
MQTLTVPMVERKVCDMDQCSDKHAPSLMSTCFEDSSSEHSSTPSLSRSSCFSQSMRDEAIKRSKKPSEARSKSTVDLSVRFKEPQDMDLAGGWDVILEPLCEDSDEESFCLDDNSDEDSCSLDESWASSDSVDSEVSTSESMYPGAEQRSFIGGRLQDAGVEVFWQEMFLEAVDESGSVDEDEVCSI